MVVRETCVAVAFCFLPCAEAGWLTTQHLHIMQCFVRLSCLVNELTQSHSATPNIAEFGGLLEQA